jgi:hypothetical protein
MGKTAVTILQNRVMLTAAIVDLVCWGALVFLGFKWITCTCGG